MCKFGSPETKCTVWRHFNSGNLLIYSVSSYYAFFVLCIIKIKTCVISYKMIGEPASQQNSKRYKCLRKKHSNTD